MDLIFCVWHIRAQRAPILFIIIPGRELCRFPLPFLKPSPMQLRVAEEFCSVSWQPHIIWKYFQQLRELTQLKIAFKKEKWDYLWKQLFTRAWSMPSITIVPTMVWKDDLDNVERVQSRKSAILFCLTSGRVINLHTKKKHTRCKLPIQSNSTGNTFFLLAKLVFFFPEGNCPMDAFQHISTGNIPTVSSLTLSFLKKVIMQKYELSQYTSNHLEMVEERKEK